MKHARPSYLRTYCLQQALSWRDLAYLLGLSEASVRKYENGERVPQATTLIALELIFGREAEDILPGLYQKVGYALIERSFALRAGLAGRMDAVSQKKLDLLNEIETRVLNAHIL